MFKSITKIIVLNTQINSKNILKKRDMQTQKKVYRKYAIGKGVSELKAAHQRKAKKEIMLQMQYTTVTPWHKLLAGKKRLFVHDYEAIQAIFTKYEVEEPWGFKPKVIDDEIS